MSDIDVPLFFSALGSGLIFVGLVWLWLKEPRSSWEVHRRCSTRDCEVCARWEKAQVRHE